MKENNFKSAEAERFIIEIKRLIDMNLASSFSEVAKKSGYKSQDFTDIKAGKKDLQRKFLESVADIYVIDKNYILTGEAKTRENLSQNGENSHTNSAVMEAEPLHLAGDPNDFNNDGSRFEELADGTIRMRVPVIPYKAFAAGYLQGFHDPEFFEDLEHTSIEVMKRHQGNYLAFEVRGDSMTTLEPEYFRQSIFDGVKVIGRELPRQQWRYKLHTHSWDAWVIVHKTEGILVKQIIAHDVDKGIISIHSLNPDKKMYPDKELFLDDIEQLFNIVKKIDE